jgi:hypothetical protein
MPILLHFPSICVFPQFSSSVLLFSKVFSFYIFTHLIFRKPNTTTNKNKTIRVIGIPTLYNNTQSNAIVRRVWRYQRDNHNISKMNRQHNGQKKKHKRTNNDLQNIHIKLKTLVVVLGFRNIKCVKI